MRSGSRSAASAAAGSYGTAYAARLASTRFT
jgi:hypothetical protein